MIGLPHDIPAHDYHFGKVFVAYFDIDLTSQISNILTRVLHNFTFSKSDNQSTLYKYVCDFPGKILIYCQIFDI